MMNRLPTRFCLFLILTATLTSGGGCSRVSIVYNSADFFAKQYADDYLSLADDQLASWEPRLKAELARHRAEELPALAAFFDKTRLASRAGFDARNTACLIAQFRDLYRRHARVAVTLATPLLANLTPTQIDALERKFRQQAREDRQDLATRDLAWEKRKRAKRYVKAIEDWTGPLQAGQPEIVAEVTGRMPDSETALIDYRARKREELLSLLRTRADEARIQAFMTAWLVEFSDLPSSLERDGDAIGERIGELFMRLGASLDERQRERLDQRLRQLRDELLNLQNQPRLAPLDC
ncbi:DUF6279 family lipoprotein [Thiocystis violascens]|uniref:Lipoprotein n=1 Tax=Thiocystis violascens (strain ATCC 17096 / DSM 198 / 6111) TaxID=765911 RepID=I3Y526_THIV6|nr:DUF6279 family lipoprotein [Thiocystis violascens]AFL72094.1 hypothetical protein Thivi_0002 [Thiocystis violascens DSM 198]